MSEKVKPGYKQTEVGVIPEEWEVEAIGDVFNISGGLSASREQLSAKGYCYLHYGDIHKSTKSFIDEYAGLGSGSIGYLNGTCYANTFDIRGYIARIDRGELPLAASRVFSVRDRIRYDFLMKLFGTRLNAAELRKKYGGAFLSLLWPDLLAFFLIGGLSWRAPDIVLTKRGRYAWVVLMREFFTAVNNFRDYCRGVSVHCNDEG